MEPGKPGMITIRINGQTDQLAETRTVSALMAARGGDGSRVAVAVNGQVVPRAEWAHTYLADGDEVLVVRPVAGGAPLDEGGQT